MLKSSISSAVLPKDIKHNVRLESYIIIILINIDTDTVDTVCVAQRNSLHSI